MVPRSNDTVAKEPARDESLPRSSLLTRLQPLGYDLRHHRVGILAWNAHDEEEKRGSVLNILEEEVFASFARSSPRTAETTFGITFESIVFNDGTVPKVFRIT